MASKGLNNRSGKSVTSIAALINKTAEHAGVPVEEARYIVSSFIDVLVDEIVTDGGAFIPGIGIFYTDDTYNKARSINSRYDTEHLYDKDLFFSMNDALKTTHRMHTAHCDEGERVITPSTWRKFFYKYRQIMHDSEFMSGIVAANKVRKDGVSPLAARGDNNFVPASMPIMNTFFPRLINEMNTTGIFDPDYHVSNKEELLTGKDRLLQVSDLTQTSEKYIINEGLEKATRLYQLVDEGILPDNFFNQTGIQDFGAIKRKNS